MLEFQLYQGMNPNAPQLTEPYRRSMTFISFIRGPNTDDWVAEQAEWLVDQVIGGVLPTEENLWRVIETRFTNAYTDRSRSQRQLRELQMKQENLNDYIVEFQSLANKGGYTLDEEATLNIFQNRLPDPLVVNIIKFHHPATWNKWTSAARIQHQEYVFLKDRMNNRREKRFGGTKGQWQKAFNHPRDPNAMDIGRTRARATLTKEEKQKLQAEGRCFRCQKQGHISHNCPQRPPARAAEASTSTIVATSTPNAPAPLTDEQKADAIIAMLGTQTQGVRDKMADKMFGDEEDFSEA